MPGDRTSQRRPTPGEIAGILVCLLGVAAVAYTALASFTRANETTALPEARDALTATLGPAASEAPQLAPDTAPLRSEPPNARGPSWPTETPTRQVVVSLDDETRRRFASFLDDLILRHPDLVLDGSDLPALPARTGPQAMDARLLWSPDPPPRGTLIGEEAYAVIVHVSAETEDVSLHDLREAAQGRVAKRVLVAPDGGALTAELLSVDVSPNCLVAAASWREAKEYVATHPEAWALVPWAVVDWRVRTLSVEGVRLRPPDVSGYPLVRRLWLQDLSLPQAIRAELLNALQVEPPDPVEMVLVGDVMLGGPIRDLLRGTSPEYPFASPGMAGLLSGADVTVGNLECALTTGGRQQAKAYTFRGDPSAALGLATAGFDVLSLANNHSGDYGHEGLLDTMGALRVAGLRHIGAGRDLQEARQPLILEVRGLRVALLAYSGLGPASFYATQHSPGCAPAVVAQMVDDVRQARGRADLVVVTTHWGIEYTHQPSALQRSTAARLAEAGACLIVGHHPHVVQGVEYRADALVAYSLGNFVFYPMAASGTSQGVVLRCLLDVTGVKSAELIPYIIVNAQPTLARGEAAAAVLGTIRRVTASMGAWPR